MDSIKLTTYQYTKNTTYQLFYFALPYMLVKYIFMCYMYSVQKKFILMKTKKESNCLLWNQNLQHTSFLGSVNISSSSLMKYWFHNFQFRKHLSTLGRFFPNCLLLNHGIQEDGSEDFLFVSRPPSARKEERICKLNSIG